jgi:hypothetical protein
MPWAHFLNINYFRFAPHTTSRVTELCRNCYRISWIGKFGFLSFGHWHLTTKNLKAAIIPSL